MLHRWRSAPHCMKIQRTKSRHEGRGQVAATSYKRNAMAYILTLKNSKNMQISAWVCANTSIYAFVYFNGKHFNAKYPLYWTPLSNWIYATWLDIKNVRANYNSEALCVCCHQCQARKVNFLLVNATYLILNADNIQHASCHRR